MEPAYIEKEVGGIIYRFLIFDSPTNANIHLYVNRLKKHNVHTIVRLCDLTYDEKIFENDGIIIHDLKFQDGTIPSHEIINYWFKLINIHFKKATNDENICIGIHCAAGLGRAPLLVCLALIFGGMDNLEIVEFIRKHRSGSINAKQLEYIRKFKIKSNDSCTIQ